MAIKKKENKTIFMLFTIAALMHVSLISAVNFDCMGKAFYCLNSTHFMICVDLGDGITKTVDDFLIPCPPPTVCIDSNSYECEYLTASTTQMPTSQQIGLERQIEDVFENTGTFSSKFEDGEITTIIPFWYNRNMEKSEQYYTESTLSENYQYNDMTSPNVEEILKDDSETPVEMLTTEYYFAPDLVNIQNLGIMGEPELTTINPVDYSRPSVKSETLENITKDDSYSTTKNYGDYFDTVSTTTLAEYSPTLIESDKLLSDVRDTATTSITIPPSYDEYVDIIRTTRLVEDISLKDIKLSDSPYDFTQNTDERTRNFPTSDVTEEPITETYNLHINSSKTKEPKNIIESQTISGINEYFDIESTTKLILDTTSNNMKISELPISTGSVKITIPSLGTSEDPGTENYDLLTDSKGFLEIKSHITTTSNYDEYLNTATTTSLAKHVSDMSSIFSLEKLGTVPEIFGPHDEITTEEFMTASGFLQEPKIESYNTIRDLRELEKKNYIPTSTPSYDQNYAIKRTTVAKTTAYEAPDLSTESSHLLVINEKDKSISKSSKEPITKTNTLPTISRETMDSSQVIMTSPSYGEYFDTDSTSNLAENPMLDDLHEPITKSYSLLTTSKEEVRTNNIIDTVNQNKKGKFDHVSITTSTEQYNSKVTNLSDLSKELFQITLLNNNSTKDSEKELVSLAGVPTTIPESYNLFTDTDALIERNITEHYNGNNETVTETSDGTLKGIFRSDITTNTADSKFVTKIPWPISNHQNIKTDPGPYMQEGGTEEKEILIREDEYTYFTTSMKDIPHMVKDMVESTYPSETKETFNNIYSQPTTITSDHGDVPADPYTELYVPLLKENTMQKTATVFSKLQVTDNFNAENPTQRHSLISILKLASTTQSNKKENTYHEDDNIVSTPILDDSTASKNTKIVYHLNTNITIPDTYKISNAEEKAKPTHAESTPINFQTVYDQPYIPSSSEITKKPLTTLAMKESIHLFKNQSNGEQNANDPSTELLLNATTNVHFYRVTTASNPFVERYASISNIELTTMHQAIDKVKIDSEVTTSSSKSEIKINENDKTNYNYETSTGTARYEAISKKDRLFFDISPEDESTITIKNRSEVVGPFNSNVEVMLFTEKGGVENIKIKDYDSQIETTLEKSVATVAQDTITRTKSNIIYNSTNPKVKDEISYTHKVTPTSYISKLKFQNISVKSPKEPLNSTILERNVLRKFPTNLYNTSDGSLQAAFDIHKNITFEQRPSSNNSQSTKYEENDKNVLRNIKNPHQTTINHSASYIIHTTLASVIHSYGFNCSNGLRGKYSDTHNCKKFYICIGRLYPIIGECPINTVFSDILKQCTRNLSHCVRRNQFQCTSAGRFSDIYARDVYYICVRNKNKYVRFKLQCQKGYILNKTSVTCIEDTPLLVSSLKYDSTSKGSSSSSVDSRSVNNQEQSSTREFECVDEGIFPDPYDCKSFYRCTKSNKSEFRRRKKKCDTDEVFHKRKKKCVDAESYEC